jgi:hypothetical protein
MALAGSVIYVLQMKGWFYQRIPALAGALAVIALASSCVRLAAHWESARGDEAFRLTIPRTLVERGLAAIIAAGFVGCLYLGATATSPEHRRRLIEGSPLARTIDQMSREGDPVLFVSTGVGPAYPCMTQLNRRPGSRYLWLFPIPMFYRGARPVDGRFPYRSAAEATEEESRFLSELAEDLRTFRPRLIFIDVREKRYGDLPAFTLHEYLTRAGLMNRILEGYRSDGIVEDMAVYVPRQ